MTTRRYEESPIERLATAPQVRKEFDDAAVERMADSIKAVGLLQPILTGPVEDKLLIVDGELRYRAALRAEVKTVPVIVEEGEPSAADTIETQLVANIHREDLRPSEKAAAIEKLIELRGLTASAAAARLGMSGGTVTRLLAILKLPEPIRRRIDAGEIPASADYDLAKISDPAEQSALAGQLATGTVTRDAVSGTVKARRRSPRESSVIGAKRVVAPLREGRSVSIGGATLSLEALIEVCEELLAKARKARTQGLTLPTFLKVLRETKA
jgi:ParB family chromosome partitioning protein